MPTSSDSYLYLIYDYRISEYVELCYSNTNLEDACCNCATLTNFEVTQCRGDGVNVTEVVPKALSAEVGDFVTLSTGDSDCVWRITSTTNAATTSTIAAIRTDIGDCNQVCNTFRIFNPTAEDLDFVYRDCNRVIQTYTFIGDEGRDICVTEIISSTGLNVTFFSCGCS